MKKTSIISHLQFLIIACCCAALFTACKSKDSSRGSSTSWSTEPTEEIVGEEKAILTDPPCSFIALFLSNRFLTLGADPRPEPTLLFDCD